MVFKERYSKEELEGKFFKIDDEEWIVEEVLLYGYKCNARSLNYDTKKIFNCSYVNKHLIK